MLQNLKIALVADWMTNFGGAEQVILSIARLFPHAHIYTSVYNKKALPEFSGFDVKTTYLQKIPFFNKRHQLLLKFLPLAFESLDLSDYDIVISSSHALSKSVITKPETMHVCYCHTPLRVVWDDFHNYLNSYHLNFLLKKLVMYWLTDLRIYDRMAAERVDFFIANSKFIQNRIKKYYRRESQVIYPPVNINDFVLHTGKRDNYYLAVGRIVPNKKMDLLVETFNKNGKKLLIVGAGIDYKRLKKEAKSNIVFCGKIETKELIGLYQNAKAFIMPQIEDFGIAPIESMAVGTPVIAFGKGGATETVINEKTGIFFNEQTKESLNEALNNFEKKEFNFKNIRKQAEKFSEERFQKELLNFISDTYLKWQKFMS